MAQTLMLLNSLIISEADTREGDSSTLEVQFGNSLAQWNRFAKYTNRYGK